MLPKNTSLGSQMAALVSVLSLLGLSIPAPGAHILQEHHSLNIQ